MSMFPTFAVAAIDQRLRLRSVLFERSPDFDFAGYEVWERDRGRGRDALSVLVPLDPNSGNLDRESVEAAISAARSKSSA